MSINIFSGSSSSKKKKNKNKRIVNTSVRTNRSKPTPGYADSAEGTVEVKKNGVLSTIGGLAKKALPFVAKYAPGVVGSVAKVAESIFNDPEWWQTVPGQAITMNVPLNYINWSPDKSERPAQFGTQMMVNPASTSRVIYGILVKQVSSDAPQMSIPKGAIRPFLLEFANGIGWITSTDVPAGCKHLFNPNDNMITQYLMPEIRKVVNAVPLQSAKDYKEVLIVNTYIYALWHTLKKWEFLTHNGKTYLPNFSAGDFPMLSVENAAFLTSTIARLEEYLSASVRLPHTLCEYLAWRFGRIYRTTDAEKSALVMYNATYLTTAASILNDKVNYLLSFTATSTSVQQAATDLYNAYYNHDMRVLIDPKTQFKYEPKEFALRCNLNVKDPQFGGLYGASYFKENTMLNPILIDSELDNPTVFMASTVSTAYSDEEDPLFPVDFVYAYRIKQALGESTPNTDNTAAYYPLQVLYLSVAGGTIVQTHTWGAEISNLPTFWQDDLSPCVDTWTRVDGGDTDASGMALLLHRATLCNALNYHNAGMYALYATWFGDTQDHNYTSSNLIPNSNPATYESFYMGGYAGWTLVDVTALAMDMGTVSDDILKNEQLFAFANLCSVDRRRSMTLNQAEAKVATDFADTVAKSDINIQ